MRTRRPNLAWLTPGCVVAAALLAILGLLAFPVAAVAGGAAFVLLGAGLAYDLRGLGARWVAWKRTLGPTLGVSVWLDRTLDGAAVAWLGIAVAWVGAAALV